LVQRADDAGSFEAALHAVAQVLRGELGARDTSVHEVLVVDAGHAQISDLIESQPGFRTIARRIRLDDAPLARALLSQREAGMPPGAVALPVLREGRVVAVIALSAIDLPVEPGALVDLLALARRTLSQRASGLPHGPDLPRETQSPSGEERLRELGFDEHLSKPFRQSHVSAMLNKPMRPPAPSGSTDALPVDQGDAAGREPRADELDAAAIARLSELDPSGESRLLERVLLAFRGSVARLRPQLEAARANGDRGEIRLVVHTLKSSSASIGARRLSQLCGQIETAIRLEPDAPLDAPLDALNGALDGALLAIDSLLKDRA
ncbi:MAG: Hpt domain-containing protein, partial [Rhizobiales bacterium]|nr:Hpt domain-containing protein [Rhizobacter sp.]